MYDHKIHRGRKHFCRYSLQTFRTSEKLKCNFRDYFEIYGKQIIKMPKNDEYIKVKNFKRKKSVFTQRASNIPAIFAECSHSISIFWTSREHLGNVLKEKIFSKVLDGKVVFVLKVYDLIITNIYLLANSSNHEVMFPEYSRNIPQISVSKIFQGYPQTIVKL